MTTPGTTRGNAPEQPPRLPVAPVRVAWHGNLRATVALTLAVCVAMGDPASAQPESPSAAGARTADSRATQASPERAFSSRQIEVVAQRVRRLRAALAPSIPSVESLGASFKDNPEKAFRFVRDQIALDAYPGILRGAVGTLEARAGNSWDRCHLLANLLVAGGKTVRFAHGRAPDTLVTRLVDRARRPPPLRDLGDLMAIVPSLPRLEGDTAAPDPGDDRALSELSQILSEDSERSVQVVEAALKGQTVTIVSPLRTAPEKAADALRDHAWLEVQEGGQWLALDPSLPDASVGQAPFEATERGDAPPGLRHGIKLCVSALWKVGGEVKTRPLLEFQKDSAELGTSVLAVSFERPESSAIAKALGGQDPTGPFAPHLTVGDGFFTGTPITLGAAGPEELVAVTLEVTVSGPGSQPKVLTRHLLDRIGQGARHRAATAPLAPIPWSEATPLLASTVYAISVSSGNIDSLRVLDESLKHLERSISEALGAGPPASPAATTRTSLESLNQIALSYHAMRAAVLPRLLPVGFREFATAPRVMIIEAGPSSSPKRGSSAPAPRRGGGLVGALEALNEPVSAPSIPPVPQGLRLKSDLVSMPSLTLPSAAAAATTSPSVDLSGVRLAALDHALERVLMEGFLGTALECDDCPHRSSRSRGAGVVFEAAAAQGIKPRLLRPGQPQSSLAAFPVDVKARMEAALAAGLLVIVPERPVELDGGPAVAMWTVDPSSGSAQDLDADGQGSAGTETAIQQSRAMRAIGWLAKYSDCLEAAAALLCGPVAYLFGFGQAAKVVASASLLPFLTKSAKCISANPSWLGRAGGALKRGAGVGARARGWFEKWIGESMGGPFH